MSNFKDLDLLREEGEGWRVRSAQGLKEKFEAVDLDFVDSAQAAAKEAGRKPLAGHPYHIGFGQVDQAPAGILAERHAHGRQFQEFLVVERGPGRGLVEIGVWRQG